MTQIKLSQADYDFIEFVKSEIAGSCALPFELPDERIPQIIYKSALFFYEWLDDSTEERWLSVNTSEFNMETSGNPVIQFDGSIQAVTMVMHNNSSASGSVCSYLRTNPIMSLGSVSNFFRTSQPDYNFYKNNYDRNFYSVSDGLARVYEAETYRTIFKESVLFNYNVNTQKFVAFNISDKTSLGIRVERRIPLADGLYNNRLFIDYVVAHGKKELSTILGTFTYQLPGEVTINYDLLRSEGIEEMDKIKQEIKESNNTDFTLYA